MRLRLCLEAVHTTKNSAAELVSYATIEVVKVTVTLNEMIFILFCRSSFVYCSFFFLNLITLLVKSLTVCILDVIFWFKEKKVFDEASKIIKQTMALEKHGSKNIEKVSKESSKPYIWLMYELISAYHLIQRFPTGMAYTFCFMSVEHVLWHNFTSIWKCIH